VREYRYRKHVRWGQYFFPIASGVVVAAVWIVLASLLRFDSPGAQVILVLASLLSLVGLVTGALGWWLYYRLAGVAITVEDDALVYRYRGGAKRFPYDRLEPLRFPSVRYLGGWLALRSGGDTIRLTVVVEGIGALLRELKAALDVRGLSDRYDKDRLYRFMKTAEFSDQSWERIYAVFWNYSLATLAGVVLGLFLARIAGARPLMTVAWMIVSGLWPTLVYTTAEILFGRRLAKLSDPASFTCPPRDPEWERALYRKAMAWGLGSYLIFAVLVFAATWHRSGS